MKKIYSLSLCIIFMLSAFLTFAGDVPAPVTKNSRSNNEKSSHHVIGGNGFTVELRAGKIFSWGKNNHGQLGNNSTTNSLTAVQENSNSDNWVDMAAGFGHTLALKADGTLWAWGQNDKGQLGIGTFADVHVPTQVGTDNDWVTIGCGGTHSLAIKADGTLWSWGNNANGQLGIGTPSSPIPSPVPVGSAQAWIGISAGFFHSAAIQSNGALFTWGLNNFGQLGINNTNSQLAPVQVGNTHTWKSVECGQYHTMGLQSNGTLWGWGKNNAGQLGDNSATNRLSPVQEATFSSTWVSMACGQADTNSSFSHTLAIKADGTLYGFGSNQFGQLGNGTANGTANVIAIQITGFTDAINVECGWACSFVRKSNGQLFAYGNNAFGNLGTGNTTNLSTPVAVSVVPVGWSNVHGGGDFSFAIAGNGTIYAWGNDNNGQLGNGIVSGAVTNALQIGSSSNWKNLFTGFRHAVGIKSDGTLFTWGNNSNGQLGDGTTNNSSSPVLVSSATANWISASCGDFHTMAIKSDGTLWGWGFNQFGQLGNGNTVDSHVPVQIGTESDWVDVECSGNFTHVIKSNGTLWAMGENTAGQLGIGTTANASIPVQVGTASNWISLGSGTTHTIAIQSNGTMWAWGSNNSGNLGNNSTVPQTSPVQIGGGINWVSVSCGTDHSIAQTPNGDIYTWGSNQNGELGDGTNNNSGVPILISAQSGIVFINCGANHTAIIKADRTLICETGLNATGQLGDGSFANRNFFGCTIVTPCIQADVPVVNASPNTICAGGSSALNITVGNLNNATDWHWYSDSLLTVSAGIGTSINVTPSSTHTFFVRGEGGCSPGPSSSVTVIVSPASAAPVVTPSGPLTLCPGTPVTLMASPYSTGLLWSNGSTTPNISVTVAASYSVTFTDANGCSYTSTSVSVLADVAVPVIATVTDINTCNSVVTFSLSATDNCSVASITSNPASGSTFANGTTTVTITATDNSGNTSTSTFLVNVTPSAPPTSTIAGLHNICVSSNYTYTANSAGATSYSWSVPSSLTIVSGQGTASIVVNTPSTPTSGVITATASNSCGTSTAANFNVTVNVSAPATPVISGPSVVCQITSATYTASSTGATSYNWTVPTGLTITSGQGTATLNVNVGGGTINGNVTATAINSCGTSAVTDYLITKKPQTPANITGPTDVCGLTSATYSIPATFGATSYAWVVPVGITISSGQGTTSINVNIASTFTTGGIKVSAVNGCGSIPGTILAVYGKAAPNVLTGPTNVCGMATATYTCNTVANATSYGWQVPASWTFTGQGTTTIVATMPANINNVTFSGVVRVHAISGCGNSADKTMTVSYCKSPESTIDNQQSTIEIYPNPTTGELGIRYFDKLSMTELGIINVEMYNVLGECVFKSEINNNQSSINISDLANGMYFVRLTDGDNNVVYTKRVIKQ